MSPTDPVQHPNSPPQHLRVFLASPGDVAEERQLALQVLEQLAYDPLLRGQVTIETVAWDKPGAGAPMLATLTPQEAIAQGLPKPSECDIVIVVFWARMGTPLPAEYTKLDGSPYRSGTEWEYLNALEAAKDRGKPKLLVYRRTEKQLLDPSDSEFMQKYEQWQQVEAFFADFRNPDGSIGQGWNEYDTPAKFEKDLALHLKALIRDLVPKLGATEHPSTPPPRIETGGGAFVAGDVKVGGDFIGRDKVQVTSERSVSIAGDATGSTIKTGNEIHHHGSADLAQAEASYRQALAKRCGILPLRGVDATAGDVSATRKPLSLAQIYIELDTRRRLPVSTLEAALKTTAAGAVTGLPETTPRESVERDEETRLVSALEAAILCRGWVLVGDPGAGKSTFVNHLTYALATQDWGCLPDWPTPAQDALPIRVILRDFARWLALQDTLPEAGAGLLWAFVVHELNRHQLSDAAPVLEQALAAGRAVVLLDGLDEVPPGNAALLSRVRESVQGFVERHDQSRHLITCRVRSYEDPRWQLPAATFPALELAPFDEPKIDRFIGAWYAEVGEKWGLASDDVERLAGKLGQAVRRPDLWRLAPNPLLLTVMALVHTDRKELPEKRVLLYQDAVDILLLRWEHEKSENVPELRDLLREVDRDVNDLKNVLERLAFEAHAQGGTGTAEEGTGIEEFTLLKGLATLYPDPNGGLGWAERLLETLRLRASLLLERQGQVFSFPHRTFQEYLAGVHLARQANFGEAAAKLAQEGAFWREVILLAVGYLVHQQREYEKPQFLVDKLCPVPAPASEEDWRQAWLAGDVLREFGVNRVRDTEYGRGLLQRVQQRLTDLVEQGELAARERAEIGDLLGELGDPRFDAAFLHLPGQYRGEPEPLAGFIEIPAGPFVMGSRKGDEEANNDEFGNPEKLHIDYPYWIGRYPVTVAQYVHFLNAGGYEESAWWTQTGWDWRQGKWDSQVEEEWLRDWLKERPAELRHEPMWWHDQRAYPNRPVVGVSWFETWAYGRWLDAELRRSDRAQELLRAGYTVRLPTEAEWEKAARHADERRYPWGNEDWDEERANIDASRISDATTVGMYPSGATPAGLQEAAGNVWEWTLSQYQPYSYDPRDGRNEPEAEELFVLRGGSYYQDKRSARCASRDGGLRGGWGDFSGFRLVLSLADSGF